jgi:integrase
MNDVTVKWKKLKKFKAKHRSVVEDKPYSREQIKTLVDAAPLRDKCIILVMASAGLRRGALPYLRIRDLQKIDKYQLYKINVYKKEEEFYITYCTPECTRLIDQYLEWRQRLGEKLQPNSPLFRIVFDTVTQVNRPKNVSRWVIARMIHQLLDTTGVRAAAETRQPTELMQTHGFRKHFKTTCINAGMNPLYSEYLMGHRSGLTKSYFKPSDMELLEGSDKALGYISAINDLTINEEFRLRKKVDELIKKKDEIELREIKHREELKSMREEMENRFQQILTKIDVTKVR